MRAAVLLIAAMALAAAQSFPPIPTAPELFAWEGMYAPPYLRDLGELSSFDCANSTTCYMAGAQNGVGFGIYSYDGQVNGKSARMTEDNTTLFIPGIAATMRNGQPVGAYTTAELLMKFSGLQYLKNGNTWIDSKMSFELAWEGPSITTTKDGSTIVAAGEPSPCCDLMVSKDQGASFTSINYTYSPPWFCGALHDIQVVTDTVWYSTWNYDPSNANNARYLKGPHEKLLKSSSNHRVVNIRDTKTGKIRQHIKTAADIRRDSEERQKKGTSQGMCDHHWGQVLKSTDAGKTWTVQYTDSERALTFVSCYDESNCVVQGYNHDTNVIASTVNGQTWGNAWTMPVYPTPNVEWAIDKVGYSSATEVWALGVHGIRDGLGVKGTGRFWKSTNAGKSWALTNEKVPDVMAWMGVSFLPDQDQVSFGAALTQYGSVQIARLKKQADYGDFIQRKCQTAGCDAGCQNYSFPQGMCIFTEGGSVQAFCTPSGIEERLYETTSCQGAFKTYMQPINTCLESSTKKYYYTNICPSQAPTQEMPLNVQRAGTNDHLLRPRDLKRA